MRSRRLRDVDDDEIVVTVGDWQRVEVRDRVSSNDCVCIIVFQLGFTSATRRHGATAQLPPETDRLDRRPTDDDVTDGKDDDVTLSGQQITMTSPTANMRRCTAMTSWVGDADGVRLAVVVVTGSRRMTSQRRWAERRSSATASRDIGRNCCTVAIVSSTRTVTSLTWWPPPKWTSSYNSTTVKISRISLNIRRNIFQRAKLRCEGL